MARSGRTFPFSFNLGVERVEGTAAPLTVAITEATEIDATFALGKSKSKGITQATTEINAAQVLTRRRSYSIAIATETDSTFALGKLKTKGISLVSEASLAQVLTARKAKSIALDLETDSSIALTKRKSRAITLNTETDVAQIIARLKQLAISIATETDAAQVIIRGAVAHFVNIALTTETDTAFALKVNPIHRLVNQATETDAAQILTRRKAYSVTLDVETDAAQAIAHLKQLGITRATELDLAHVLTAVRLYSITLASEIDEAGFAERLPNPQFIEITEAIETDEVVGQITFTKQKDIACVNETDLARNITVQLGSEGGVTVRRRHGVFYYGHRGRMGI